MQAKKKTKKAAPKKRNPYTLPARSRKAGPHKNKASKRAKEDKRPSKYLTNEDH